MKRTLSLFLTLALMLTLTACGPAAGQGNTGSDPTPDVETPASAAPETPPTNQPEDTMPPEDETPAETDDGRKKILIAYFSATNHTEGIADHLDSILEADLYEIQPEIPYTSEDLNYNTDCRANREQNDDSARPAISGSVENMGQYDVVFLGYPIWWGKAPKIIHTFLESYDLSGKTIVPFCTSGSSGIGSSAANLQSLTENTTWLAGQRFGGNASESTVKNWVNGLGLELDLAD